MQARFMREEPGPVYVYDARTSSALGVAEDVSATGFCCAGIDLSATTISVYLHDRSSGLTSPTFNATRRWVDGRHAGFSILAPNLELRTFIATLRTKGREDHRTRPEPTRLVFSR